MPLVGWDRTKVIRSQVVQHVRWRVAVARGGATVRETPRKYVTGIQADVLAQTAPVNEVQAVIPRPPDREGIGNGSQHRLASGGESCGKDARRARQCRILGIDIDVFVLPQT